MAVETTRPVTRGRFVSRNDDSSTPSSNKNNDQNGGSRNSEKNDNNRDSGPPNGNSNSFGFPPKPPCFGPCINDNDAKLIYQGPWVLDNDPFGGTTHSTTTPGSSVSLNFNGSGIVVLGHVPESNDTHPPPTISYTIDEFDPILRTEPQAAKTIRTQPLFAIDNLSNQEHKLVLNVTEAAAPFILDHFFLFQSRTALQKVGPSAGVPPASGASSVSSPQGLQSSSEDSETTLKAVSATLGSLILILLCILAYLSFLLRKSRRVSYVDLESSYRRSMKSDTIFTSSDSIMRYHPQSWVLSDYSRNTVSLPLPSLPHTSPSTADARSPAGRGSLTTQ
ncbi:hypothetical protein Moror_10901 [Moniliophthora roreri MCA 2997]|uniref:Uncharacterized protein n=2 Tax=Moniliophthora roreri TaxID=221103 RepID=V2X276_MONRO|nr:hypothetical protein Moror_10901 [Moniliophthora roreri MCA 2997]